MAVAILENLTEEEAHDFIAKAAHRHPAIVLSVRSHDDGALFDVVVDDHDATNYPDVIDAIVRGGVPRRFNITNLERRIADLLRDALGDGSLAAGNHNEGTPLAALCQEMEWRLVPELTMLVSDGFLPSTITPIERGLHMEGVCWFFPDCREWRFRAEIALAADDTLGHFDLLFGDAGSMKATPTDLEATERSVHGYTVTRRGSGDRFTCHISKPERRI